MVKDDIIICDAGKYGYAMLTYYKPPIGFDGIIVFADSRKMYDTLLQEWFISLVEKQAKTMDMSELDTVNFYEKLSDEQKASLIQQRQQFIEETKNCIFYKLL